jgi:hypothetical protein
MHSLSAQARRTMFAAVMVALSACGDQATPTSVAPDLPAQHAICTTCGGDGGDETPPTISLLTLSTTTITINGPSVSYTAKVSDPSRLSGLSLHGSLIQGSTTHTAGNAALSCGSTTSCTGSSTFTATGFVPGSATFRIQLLDAYGAVQSTLTRAVTLVSAAQISALSLTSTSLYLDGPLGSDQITLQNAGPSLSGVVLQGWINQGTTRRAAGGSVAVCGSTPGVLPNGTCTMTADVVASNTGAGTGLLVLGAATFELDLTVNGTVVGTKTVAITLTSSATISNLSLESTFLVLNGTATPYDVTFENVGASRAGMAIQGWVNQGSVRHAASGSLVRCGAADGVLPGGGCTFSFLASANNGLSGPGTLVPGAATFELQLLDTNNVVMSTRTVAVTIVANAPRISALSLSSATAVINGANVPLTVTLENPGPTSSDVSLQGWIVQGAVRHAAGGTITLCGSNGVVPTGTCTMESFYGAANGLSGAGTLVAGAATLELDLLDANKNVLSAKSVQVTLTNQ